MKITILHKRADCIGCNACVEHAPSYWEMGIDGKSTLKQGRNNGQFFTRDSYDAEDLASLREAEEDCPVKVIRVEIK